MIFIISGEEMEWWSTQSGLIISIEKYFLFRVNLPLHCTEIPGSVRWTVWSGEHFTLPRSQAHHEQCGGAEHSLGTRSSKKSYIETSIWGLLKSYHYQFDIDKSSIIWLSKLTRISPTSERIVNVYWTGRLQYFWIRFKPRISKNCILI